MFGVFILILCAITLVESVPGIVFKLILLGIVLLISVFGIVVTTKPAAPKPAPSKGHGGGHGGGHGDGHGGSAKKEKTPTLRWISIGMACLCLYFLTGWLLSWRDAKLYAREGAEKGYTMRPFVVFEDEDFGVEWSWRVYGFDRHTCRQEGRMLRCSPFGNCELEGHPIDLGDNGPTVACVPTRAPYPMY